MRRTPESALPDRGKRERPRPVAPRRLTSTGRGAFVGFSSWEVLHVLARALTLARPPRAAALPQAGYRNARSAVVAHPLR
ncbi:hypothetical protein [Kitasatospora camelliae]|uniref:Uncharacterized protein n=1 Tax=Kitasatospora camelliae TaxID=3156397 RepID=A0AAU8K6W5_9ACTN